MVCAIVRQDMRRMRKAGVAAATTATVPPARGSIAAAVATATAAATDAVTVAVTVAAVYACRAGR